MIISEDAKNPNIFITFFDTTRVRTIPTAPTKARNRNQEVAIKVYKTATKSVNSSEVSVVWSNPKSVCCFLGVYDGS